MLLTIYIPTYRRESVVHCVESIISQMTDQVELIISDNDEDGFANVIKAMETKFNVDLSDVTYETHNSETMWNIISIIVERTGAKED